MNDQASSHLSQDSIQSIQKTTTGIKRQKGHLNSTTKFILFIVIIVLCSGSVYYWQHRNANNLAQKVTYTSNELKAANASLTEQEKKLNNVQSELNAANQKAGSTTSISFGPVEEPTKITSSNLVEIPELGIEFPLPTSLSDLTYSVNLNLDYNSLGGIEMSAYISTASLTKLAPQCSPSESSGNGGFDAIVVGSGQWYGNQPDEYLVKQFPTKYVALAHGQELCAQNGSYSQTVVNEVTNDVGSDTIALNSALSSVSLAN